MNAASSGIGKAAGEMMKEMQKAQQQLQDQQKNSTTVGSSSNNFQQTMQANQTQQTGKVQQTKATTQVHKATNVLKMAKTNTALPSTRVGAAAKAERSKTVDMLEKMMSGQNKMGKIMDMALSGKQFNPAELLAMQAGIYKFSQELELTSKVVEKTTSSIKQTMNTQV